MDIVDGWVDGVRHCPSPNFNERPGGTALALLVIHNISLPPGEYGGGYIEKFFQNRLDACEHSYFKTIADLRVSAHFLIDRSGQITQFVSCDDRAWHAGASNYCGKENCNDFSIGIELEGQDIEAYTDAQYTALTLLTNTIVDVFPDINNKTITGHSDIAPGRKSDPGESFDWPRYLDSLT